MAETEEKQEEVVEAAPVDENAENQDPEAEEQGDDVKGDEAQEVQVGFQPRIRTLRTTEDAVECALKFAYQLNALYNQDGLFTKEDFRGLFSKDLRKRLRVPFTHLRENNNFEVAWTLLGNTQMEYHSRESNVEVIEYTVDLKGFIVEVTFREHVVLHNWMNRPVIAKFVWTINIDHYGRIGKLTGFRRENYESYFRPAYKAYGTYYEYEPLRLIE